MWNIAPLSCTQLRMNSLHMYFTVNPPLELFARLLKLLASWDTRSVWTRTQVLVEVEELVLPVAFQPHCGLCLAPLLDGKLGQLSPEMRTHLCRTSGPSLQSVRSSRTVTWPAPEVVQFPPLCQDAPIPHDRCRHWSLLHVAPLCHLIVFTDLLLLQLSRRKHQ